MRGMPQIMKANALQSLSLQKLSKLPGNKTWSGKSTIWKRADIVIACIGYPIDLLTLFLLLL